MARADSRTRLREFQANLAERLAQAKTERATASKLGIGINDERWLVELGEAGEIVPLQDMTPVPHTFSWYRGLTNVRGNLISIIDLSLFAGGPPTRVERESRLLAFSPALEFNAGVIVTRMLGLHNLQGWNGMPDTAGLPIGRPGVWADPQDLRWGDISFRALMADERFLKISPL